jgi:uncharacterized membrane protein
MSPRLRFRLQLVGLLAALFVTGASAASMLDTARLVEIVGLAGGAFAAGASFIKLIADRRIEALTADRDAGASTRGRA